MFITLDPIFIYIKFNFRSSIFSLLQPISLFERIAINYCRSVHIRCRDSYCLLHSVTVNMFRMTTFQLKQRTPLVQYKAHQRLTRFDAVQFCNGCLLYIYDAFLWATSVNKRKIQVSTRPQWSTKIWLQRDTTNEQSILGSHMCSLKICLEDKHFGIQCLFIYCGRNALYIVNIHIVIG